MIKYKLYRFQVQLWHIWIVVHDGHEANKLAHSESENSL